MRPLAGLLPASGAVFLGLQPCERTCKRHRLEKKSGLLFQVVRFSFLVPAASNREGGRPDAEEP
jgi:hypothetical protein